MAGEGAADASSAKTASGDKGKKESRNSLKGGVGRKSVGIMSRPSCAVGSCGNCFSGTEACVWWSSGATRVVELLRPSSFIF